MCQGTPSTAEWDRHVVSHMPFREWCRHCVAGRVSNVDIRSIQGTMINIYLYELMMGI